VAQSTSRRHHRFDLGQVSMSARLYRRRCADAVRRSPAPRTRRRSRTPADCAFHAVGLAPRYGRRSTPSGRTFRAITSWSSCRRPRSFDHDPCRLTRRGHTSPGLHPLGPAAASGRAFSLDESDGPPPAGPTRTPRKPGFRTTTRALLWSPTIAGATARRIQRGHDEALRPPTTTPMVSGRVLSRRYGDSVLLPLPIPVGHL